MYTITDFLSQQVNWSPGEDRKRVAHALIVVEKLVEPAVYEKTRDVELILIEALRGRRVRGAKSNEIFPSGIG